MKATCFCASDQDLRIERTVLAQLTQLYMTVKLECPIYEVNTSDG